MNKCPYCYKNFKTWKGVQTHTGSCKESTGEYYISNEYGPIHYKVFIGKNWKEIRNIYPKLISLTDIKKSLRKRGFDIGDNSLRYTREELISYINKFVEKYDKVPVAKDFDNLSKIGKAPSSEPYFNTFGTWVQAIEAAGLTSEHSYSNEELLSYIKTYIETNNKSPTTREFINNSETPSIWCYKERFGSWNNAILLAGGTPNLNNMRGIPTKGLDGIIYRSKLEAYFCDTFLFNKHYYLYEIKYPNPYNYLYDFYLPHYNLYIEIAGGLDMDRIKEKININNKLNRTLLVFTASDIYNKENILLGKVI